MIPVLGAAAAVLGAGIAYGGAGRSAKGLAERVVAALLMFVGGALAIPLFGPEDAYSSYLKMVAALWLPQFLLGVWRVSPRGADEK